MSTIDVSGARRAALMVVLGQLAATLILAATFLIGWDTRAAVSALIGGGVSVAASLAMVFFMFRGASADPQRILRSAYRGEAAKLGITVLLIVAALKSMELAVVPFFVTYAATLLVYWIALVKAPAG
jgi:ATP synthase protein I